MDTIDTMRPIRLKDLVPKTDDYTQSVNKIKHDCKSAIKLFSETSAGLFRGDNNTGVFYRDPSKFDRPSANTSNYYTTLVKGSPVWRAAEIPTRHNSIIMSTSPSAAEEFGTVFVVFPIDGASIAFGKAYDNWSNHEASSMKLFGTNHVTVDDLNVCIGYILKYLTSKDHGNISDYEKLVGLLRHADEQIKKNPKDLTRMGLPSTVQNAIAERGLLNVLTEYIDPIKNGIDSEPIEKFRGPTLLRDREMWTDSPCWFIDVDRLDILKELGVEESVQMSINR